MSVGCDPRASWADGSRVDDSPNGGSSAAVVGGGAARVAYGWFAGTTATWRPRFRRHVMLGSVSLQIAAANDTGCWSRRVRYFEPVDASGGLIQSNTILRLGADRLAARHVRRSGFGVHVGPLEERNDSSME